jgi:predicted short-subunit dehydrogenase-like oxidoreductase (DUF2520 family)
MDPRAPLDVAIVGAGRVGTALGVLLAEAGHHVVAASGRSGTKARVDRFLPGLPFVSHEEAAAAASVVLVGVPDDSIATVCLEIAGSLHPGQGVVHLSGSASLETLAAARARGAGTLSMHPLQTFPGVVQAIERLPGSGIAVTADDEESYSLGERLARDAGGRPFRLSDDQKPLYHAAAVFCSNYLAAVQSIAEELFHAAGLDNPVPLFAPLARATLDNVLELGPTAALTGPAARGDAGTVQRNLEALRDRAPWALPSYVALAHVATEMAQGGGRLDAAGRERVEKVLTEWR